MSLLPKTISDKKAAQIERLKLSPIKVGNYVYVPYNIVNVDYPRKEKEKSTVLCEVLDIASHNPELLKVTPDIREKYKKELFVNSNVVTRYNRTVGENPFQLDALRQVRTYNKTLDSLIFELGILGEKEDHPYYEQGIEIKRFNWNPLVIINGEKKFYQRPFVWSVQDNQTLIESIYLGIECGRILIRNRSFEEIQWLVASGETDIAFKDIVDGKQRLNAIRGFIKGEFSDLHGNFYGDLSEEAQYEFGNHQLFGYSELAENTPDKDVVNQFLRVNFAGVPQSIDHITYVKSLYNDLD